MRASPEWRGKTDESPLPVSVKLRILEREDRICKICGQAIRPGDGTDYHHEPALADGGKHREFQIFPVHRKCHRMLTAREALERAESRKTIAHHYGLKAAPKRKLQSRNSFRPQASNARKLYADRDEPNGD